MTCIKTEPVPVTQCSREVVEQLVRNLLHLAALMADEVHVLVVASRVRRRAVPDVCVPHQPEVFQQVKRPVNGGDVDRRGRLLDAFAHLFRCGVFQRHDRVQHELTLGRHPHAAFVQGGLERRPFFTSRLHVPNICGSTLTLMPVLALLDGTIADSTHPLIRVDDLGLMRGDGIFETVLVVDGKPRELGPHFDRLVRSAAMLDMPEPSRADFDRATKAVLDNWTGGAEIALKWVYTRGIEGGDGTPTGFALGLEISETVKRQRASGIAAVTLDRGFDNEAAVRAPWLLLGAKTLSYAVNMAALREAARRGAEEVIFTTSDDFVLEGPTSTLVAVSGKTLRTPPATIGILPGTTQAALFRAAEREGWSVKTEPLRVSELAEADGLFFTSSVRKITRLHTLNGTQLPDSTAIHTELDRLYNSEYS